MRNYFSFPWRVRDSGIQLYLSIIRDNLQSPGFKLPEFLPVYLKAYHHADAKISKEMLKL